MATNDEKKLMTEVCNDIYTIRMDLARTGQELLWKEPEGDEWVEVVRADMLLAKMANSINRKFKLLMEEQGEKE